jgi:uncharacterized protein with GYD domain
MATFISLINWTDQGIRNYKQTTDRAQAAAAAAEAVGGTLKEIYWTVGPYDIVTVAEFPDDETGTAFLLALGAQGNIRSTTMRAWNTDEIQSIISRSG